MAGKGKAKTTKPKSKAGKSKSAYTKSDMQSMVCSSFITETGDEIDNTFGNGLLANQDSIAPGATFTIHKTMALDPRNPLFVSNTHASYTKLFNEFNCSAVYLDLLFSPDLRANADQVFLLVERGNKDPIISETSMVSDSQHKMYQLGNNTQKLSFKHVYNTAADRINKLSAPSAPPSANDLTFCKILCIGKNTGATPIPAGDLQIKIRAKCYNKYRDMKVLTAALN